MRASTHADVDFIIWLLAEMWCWQSGSSAAEAGLAHAWAAAAAAAGRRASECAESVGFALSSSSSADAVTSVSAV